MSNLKYLKSQVARLWREALSSLLKDSSRLSFRGFDVAQSPRAKSKGEAAGDEESRISCNFRARFLAKFTLSSFAALRAVRSGRPNELGMTGSPNVFQTVSAAIGRELRTHDIIIRRPRAKSGFRVRALVTLLMMALLTLLTECPLQAQISPEPEVPGSLGVNIHFVDPAPGEMAMLAASGVRWIRMDFNWAAIEPAAGQYDFSAYDRLVAALDTYHLRALFILDYHNPLYDNGLSPASDQARQAFATWAAAAVTHFRGHGILWEMYNEPNSFWTPRPNAEAYIKLALATGEAVHEAAPDEQLIGPASAVIDPPFLEACFRAGLLNYWSAVSVHPYRRKDPETAADDLRDVRLLIRKYAPPGKNVPVLAGEWGYSSLWPDMNGEKQGAMLAREWLAALANEVPLVIWYDWRDGGDSRDPETHFGLVGLPEAASASAGPTPNGPLGAESSKGASGSEPLARPPQMGAGAASPFHSKPAYLAAQTLIHFLDGFRFNKRLSVENPDDYLLLFTKGDEVRLAAWTTASQHTAVLPASPGQFELTSFTGEKLPALAADRHGLSVTLTRSPRYLMPVRANPLLTVAAAWQRLPPEIVVRAPGVLPLHLTVKNATSSPVRLDARVAEDSQEPETKPNPFAVPGTPAARPARNSWEWEAGPAEKTASGAEATLMLRVGAATRSVKPAPLRVEIEAGKLGTVAQTTWIVASNPLRLTLLPATASQLPIAIANPSGDSVQGWIEGLQVRGLRLSMPSVSGDIKAGVKTLIAALPLEGRPDGEYAVGVSIVDNGGHPISSVEPSRFLPIGDLSRGAAGAAPAEYKLVAEGAAQPDVNVMNTTLPPDGPPVSGMSATQISFHLLADHSLLRIVPTSPLMPIPGDSADEPKALGLWLHGDASGVLPFIRFTDATGQTFQDGGGPVNWKGWRYVLVHLASAGGSHSGGANDGVIHYPIHWDSVLTLENPPSQTVEGSIYLTGLTLIYGPAGE
jgi:polysaccharide biosynthesis protein PslG